jgi:DNA-binding ferritin-like protein
MTTRLATIAQRTRARMDRMGEQDAASQDFVIEILQGLEKQLWMMRVQMTGT